MSQSNNGGILIDISEGGLNFQVVGAVIEGDVCEAKFLLPGMDSSIQGNCQVVWSKSSKKGGGLRFVDFSDQALRRIRAWVSNEAPTQSIKNSPAFAPTRVDRRIAGDGYSHALPIWS